MAYLNSPPLRIIIILIGVLSLNGCFLDRFTVNENTRSVPTSPSCPPCETKATPDFSPGKNAPVFDTTTYHYIQSGETLYHIAQLYGVSANDLLRWNPSINPNNLRVGDKIAVSGPPSDYVADSDEAITYPVDDVPSEPGNNYVDYEPPFYSPKPSPPTSDNRIYHVVRSGETLFKISRRYNVSIEELMGWNNITDPGNLQVGEKLRIYPKGDYDDPPKSTPKPKPRPFKPVAPPNSGYHIVQKGETLYSISKQYGLTVDELASLNGFSQPYPPLAIEQRLIVTGNASSTPSQPVQPSLPSNIEYHIVKAGETLYQIANQYGYPVNTIANWNQIPPPYFIQVGQRIRVSPPTQQQMVSRPSFGIQSHRPMQPNQPMMQTNRPMMQPNQPMMQTNQPMMQTNRPMMQPNQPMMQANRPMMQPNQPMMQANRPMMQPNQPMMQANNQPRMLSPQYNPQRGQVPRQPPRGYMPRFYTVEKGETLYRIASQYNYPYTAIAQWNRIPPPYEIYAGETLIVSPPPPDFVPRPRPQPKTKTIQTMTTQVSVQHASPQPGNLPYHIVQPGENLYRISETYGHPLKAVASWNQLRPPYTLKVGQRLLVMPLNRLNRQPMGQQPRMGRGQPPMMNRGQPPMTMMNMPQQSGYPSPPNQGYPQPTQVGPACVPCAPNTQSPRGKHHHIVSKGESLSSIAALYDKTTHELARWNGIGSPYTVYPGQRLLIP